MELTDLNPDCFLEICRLLSPGDLENLRKTNPHLCSIIDERKLVQRKCGTLELTYEEMIDLACDARMCNHYSCWRYLIGKIDCPEKLSGEPLYRAVKNGWKDLVEIIMSKGVTKEHLFSIRDALTISISEGRLDLFQIMLPEGMLREEFDPIYLYSAIICFCDKDNPIMLDYFKDSFGVEILKYIKFCTFYYTIINIGIYQLSPREKVIKKLIMYLLKNVEIKDLGQYEFLLEKYPELRHKTRRVRTVSSFKEN